MPDTKDTLQQRLADINESLTADNESMKDTLSQYSKFGDPSSIEESLTRMTDLETTVADQSSQLNSIQESLIAIVGAPGLSISESLEKVKEVLAAGTEAQDQLKSIEESLGTAEQISESIDQATVMTESLKDILESLGTDLNGLKTLAAEFGTVGEITESITAATAALQKIQESKDEEAIASCAKKYGKSVDDIKGIMEKFSLKNAEGVCEFFTAAGVKPEDDEEEDVKESYQPGSALNGIMTGTAFRRPVTDIEENAKNRKKFNDDESINESMKPGDRMLRLL